MHHQILQQLMTLNAIPAIHATDVPEEQGAMWATISTLKSSLKFVSYQLNVLLAKGNYHFMTK